MNPQDPDLILAVTPESAAREFIAFPARRPGDGQEWSFSNRENELAIILLSWGSLRVPLTAVGTAPFIVVTDENGSNPSHAFLEISIDLILPAAE